MLLKFPEACTDLEPTAQSLERALSSPAPLVRCGRETFLAAAALLRLAILHHTHRQQHITHFIIKCLHHPDYEVILAALDYILILNDEFEHDSCPFREHLAKYPKTEILRLLVTNSDYIPSLCKVLNHAYLECKQKTLRILAVGENTQQYIVNIDSKIISKNRDLLIAQELIHCVRTCHENLTHIYLKALLTFVTKLFKEEFELLVSNPRDTLEVIRVFFECSTAENDEDTRCIAMSFLELHYDVLNAFMFNGPALTDAELLEYEARVRGAAAALLQDHEPALRRRAAHLLAGLLARAHAQPHAGDAEGVTSRAVSGVSAVTSERAEQFLRAGCSARGLVLLALMDYRCDVIADDPADETKVFDQNESYNSYIEEGEWTRECVARIKEMTITTHATAESYVESVLQNDDYKEVIKTICVKGSSADFLKRKYRNNNKVRASEVEHPRIAVFLNELRRSSAY